MATSETMQAWRLNDFNENVKKAIESMETEEVDIPVPEEGQLLLKVSYSSVNPIDWKLFTGGYQEITPIDRFPYTPGFDVAGKVMSSALGFNIGDRVCTNTGLLESCKSPAPLPCGPAGAWGKFVVVPASACVKIAHEKTKLKDVAGLPLAGVTAYQALFDSSLGDVKSGNKVLILGASGGVGSLAVQLAKNKGNCFVCATASKTPMSKGSEVTKIDLVESLGADVVIDYKKKDWSKELAGANYDMIFDCVGNPEDLEKSANVLKKDGRFVSIANFTGEAPNKDVYYTSFLLKAKKDDLQELVDMVEKGELIVPLDSQYEFVDVKDALQHSYSGRATGKILIKVG